MSAQPIQPFWERLSDIALYPLQTPALMSIGVLAIARLGGLLPGLAGFILNLVVSVALYKYAFEVLRATANGRMQAPEGGLGMRESIGMQAIWLQVAFFAGCLAAFWFGGLWLGLLISMVLMFGLPGATMSYAIDENFWHALNPATWLQVMARLGWPYFLAFGLMAIIQIGTATAQSAIDGVLPAVLGIPVFHLLSGYALIATFHLMGYLIWQYHEELGYAPEEQVTLSHKSSDPDQAVLDDAMEMVRDGEIDMAVETLREHLRSRGGTEAMHTLYRKVLRQKSDVTELLNHGKTWLPILLAQDKEKVAVDLCRELVELDPTFYPADAESNARMARRAAALGNAQLALRLINGFHKRHPKSADIPEMYLIAARTLSERMGKDTEARALLTQIKRAYPTHALIPEIDSLLALIDKVGSPAAATT